ncbi:hypothetical protein PanWU01x14_150940 [Parasponia andersonii]|uniref:Uncharacterized protein n=1 Tax=Parasponia andersonii TaxID=3476 RepID=A0A2P5CHZ7_PARAD|nr:hypothetical protein PanWU01x14_150940 [Parasponia andersonii]
MSRIMIRWLRFTPLSNNLKHLHLSRSSSLTHSAPHHIDEITIADEVLDLRGGVGLKLKGAINTSSIATSPSHEPHVPDIELQNFLARYRII